jgi:imidazolonepropionase-like amidohydrolase
MTEPTRYRIEATQLIPGDASPISPGTVVIDRGAIEYAGEQTSAPHSPLDVVVNAETVMPGLWDAHCHFFGIREMDVSLLATETPTLRAMRVGIDAQSALMAGITSVRELGGLGVDLARAVDEGSVVGPHIYAAGAILSMTGGHADLHDFPAQFVSDGGRVIDFETCDGISECLSAVRRQLRRGATVIKVCASGGVLSLDDPQHAQFSHEELKAIVDEARRADRVVAAHCHGKAGIMAALKAGVATIEHGTYLDAEAARAMADTGAILVSTRFVGHDTLSNAAELGIPEFARKKLEVAYEQGREAVGHAITAGVRIAAGTDLIASRGRWGHNAGELALLVECGMDRLGAIQAATAHAALTVGPQSRTTGTLSAGEPADVITVTGDPLSDISILEGPDRISHVWKDGELVS